MRPGITLSMVKKRRSEDSGARPTGDGKQTVLHLSQRPPQFLIGEVTRLLAITKNDHRPRLANPLDEPNNTHVRTTRKTIDREVPQNRNIDTVKMMVAVTKSLGTLFRCRVRRERPARIAIF